MKIAIIGCGAMGTILGAYMNKNGLPVDMIDSYKEHVDAMNANGAHIVDHVDFTVPVRALLPEQMEGIYDLVFLFTKQTANEAVMANLLPHLGPDSVVCTLQNGVPEPFVDRLVGGGRTVGGTVLWGATFVGPGVSAQTMNFTPGWPLFDIGEISGKVTPRILAVKGALDYMGYARIVRNLMGSRWHKLVINACGSGMSAALGSPFGPIIDDPRGLECMAFLGHEVGLCAVAEGYEPDWPLDVTVPGNFEALEKKFFANYDFQRGAKASMLQDLEKGRRTEVRMINGYVCETGRKHGIPTPYNDAVVEIVEKIERGELPLSMDNLKYFPDIRY